MNCLTARQTLELARPGEPEAAGADEAARHVSGCPACQRAFRRQEEFDQRIGTMLRGTPVPAGLKDRLLASLEAIARAEILVKADGVPSPATGLHSPPVARLAPAKASAVGSRRRWLGAISLAIAGCVMVGLGWSLWPRPQLMERDGVTNLLVINDLDPSHLPELTQFANGLAPKVPATMITRGLGLPRRLGNMDVAVYFFTLRNRRGAALAGRLAVIPKRLVKLDDVPTAASFLAGPPEYKPGFCTTAWIEGDFVYVCCLAGGESELHLLIPKRPTPI
jgi:hypothetical protein